MAIFSCSLPTPTIQSVGACRLAITKCRPQSSCKRQQTALCTDLTAMHLEAHLQCRTIPGDGEWQFPWTPLTNTWLLPTQILSGFVRASLTHSCKQTASQGRSNSKSSTIWLRLPALTWQILSPMATNSVDGLSDHHRCGPCLSLSAASEASQTLALLIPICLSFSSFKITSP